MLLSTNGRARSCRLLATACLLCLAAPSAYPEKARSAARQGTAGVISVDARVALASLISLSDTQLTKLADSLAALAASEAGRSGEWDSIRDPLAEVAKHNVPAAFWFALPDGSYWTVQSGRVDENLANRPYFPRLLAGKRVIGDLLVSRSTGKSSAIVAVPVSGTDGSVVGALGASVYLDRLSLQIRRSMDLDDTMIFFSFDNSPLLGLVWDPGLILVNPNKLGEVVGNAFGEMLSRDEGAVSYVFRGKKRVVIYRKSPVTGWRYAFGILPGDRPATAAVAGLSDPAKAKP